jgi:molybdenum cofactor synthesis domain-containing protein
MLPQRAEGDVTAGLVVIGDEILSGRTKDANIGIIAAHFTEIGIRLREVRVIGDCEADIIEAVNALRQRYDYLVTTGGIGPTHDDITAEAIAKAFGVALRIDPDAVTMLRRRFTEAELTPVRLRMARIPEGAMLIENPLSHAPGFMIGNVAVLAGVPRIMTAMLEALTPHLRTGAKWRLVTIEAHEPEGEIATVLGETQAEFPDIRMGSYPFHRDTLVGTHLVLRATDEERLRKAAAALQNRLSAQGLRFLLLAEGEQHRSAC